MALLISTRRFLFGRGSLALLPLMSFLLIETWAAPPGAAPKPPRPREEEEEPVRPKLKPPPRVEEDDLPAQPIRKIGARAIELQREAELAKNPVIRDFYLRLAVPHDEVSFPGGIRGVQAIAPLPEYVGPQPNFAGKLHWRCLDAQGRLGKEEEASRRKIAGIEHYEALAVSQVDGLLARPASESVPRLEQLQHAEKALAEVVRFHEEAWERGIRKGGAWETLDKRLRAKLLEVRLGQLRTLVEARDWDHALELAAQLAEIYPHHPEVRSAVIQVHVRRALRGLQEDHPETFIAARQALDQLERQFPNAGNDEAALALRRRLQAKAGAYLRRAQEIEATDKPKAQAFLRTAESIWPKLGAGMDDLRQRLQPYQPLRVGVAQVPLRVSPAAAVTDSEKQAVELVFESLVRPVPDSAVGSRYESILAAGRPQLVSLGRQFELVRDARWYRAAGPGSEPGVDEPLIGSDVLATVDCYQHWEGRSPEWDELLAGARDVKRDPFRVRLSLHRGYCDPLALMTFKVLPVKYLKDGRADDPGFARSPVGSGPYQYLGHREGDPRTGTLALFQVNPTYSSRTGKTGLPHVREIHFFRSRDPVVDFRNATLHLLLDLPTDQIRVLKSPAAGLGQVEVYTLRNRRVYFLAANHRHPQLRNPALRRAIGLAIDREKILDQCFRDNYHDDHGQVVHRILNGPYPPGCWAYDPNVKADLLDGSKARSLARKFGTAASLELLYPADMPHVAEACEAIRGQVEAATGIRLTLRGLPLVDFHRAVVVDHKYELAYFWWDHPNDSYWLGPLFDSRGGRNFLGPVGDSELDSLFTDLLAHREFAKVQEKTRQIHVRLADRMPLIPLWQLDTHLAVHKTLKIVPEPSKLDPLLIFTHAEQWRLGK